ncbi:MAG TPA: flagellar filament capping protein FliD [Candidatus Baltobacteraceae bacterium]|jgi:flagellar hook-associated protein 2|nr:flagellar filament capping protein FliD [Candidatus Baltobacteraceae bacterium]
MSSSVPGTNVPPISFPGIASGIDYNSIITKLTSLTLQQNVSLNAQVATLNAANAELIKINDLISAVQKSLGGLSDPSIFSSFTATSSDPSSATASAIAGSTPIAGTYRILNSVEATATTITNAATAGHGIKDGGSDTKPIAQSYAAVTPTNGPSGGGTVTVNGVQIKYNVNTDSLQTILANITTKVQAATGDASFSATLNAAGEVVMSSTNKPITLGSAGDAGNILSVFKLTTAQVNNTATSGSVTSTSNVGGINQAEAFNGTTSAGYVTPVTSGTFTINGVQITLNAANDNTASVIARINASSAGVTASFDATTNTISLAANATGPQSIIVGAGGDTSNFLSAAGLTTASGATVKVGTQASVTVQSPVGATTTIYSNSNQITTAIPGVQLNIFGFTAPYSVTVGQDNSKLISALNTFVSSYNAAISEINTATEPPAIITPTPGSTQTPTSSAVGGGVLWSNSNIINVKNQLTSVVSGFFGGAQRLDSASYTSPTPEYYSLASIGLQVSSSFSIISTSSNSGANSTTTSQPVTTQQLQGTDGTLQPLNVTTLEAALAANPNQVQQIFQGASSLTNQLGNYLGQVTGLPTLLTGGLVGTLAAGGTAIIQGFENTNTDSISSLQDRIKQVTDNANMQANNLRKQFVATESTMAQLQAEQSQLSAFFGTSGSSGG